MITGNRTWLGNLRWGIFLWSGLLLATLVVGTVTRERLDARAKAAIALANDISTHLGGLDRIDLSTLGRPDTEAETRRFRAAGSTFIDAFRESAHPLARRAMEIGGSEGSKLALLLDRSEALLADRTDEERYTLEPAESLRKRLVATRTQLGQALRVSIKIGDDAVETRADAVRLFWLVWFSIFTAGLFMLGFHAKKRWLAIDEQSREMSVELARYGTYLKLIESSYRISQSDGTPQDCLERLVAEYGLIAGWDMGHVLVPSPAGGLKTTGNWFCSVDNSHPRFRRISESITFVAGHDLPGEVLAAKTPVWYEALEDCPTSQRLRVAGEIELKSGFAFPIIANGGVVAVVELFDVSQRAVEDQLLEVTAIVCAHMASLFERELAQANVQEIESQLRAHQIELEMQQHLIDVQQASINDQRIALDELQMELETQRAIHSSDRSLRIEESVRHDSDGLRDLYSHAARRFEELFHGVPVACFTCDTTGAIYEWNSAAQDLWGYIAPQILERSAYDLLFPGESREELASVFERVFAGEPVENLEVECVDMTGRKFWVLGSLFPTRGTGRTITGAVWSCVDISERMAMEERLRESEELVRTSMESMQSGVIMFGPEGDVQMVNPRMCELLWMSHKTLTAPGFRFEDLRPLDADGHVIPKEELPVYRSLVSGEKCQDVVMGIRRVDGGVVWFSASSAPVARTEASGGRAVVMSFADITMKMASERTMLASLREVQLYSSELEHKAAELAYANARLENLATTDGLTGLKNQRVFQEFLEQSMQLAKRHKEPLSLMLLDVDHFKQYNDTFGHPAGDEILKELASILGAQSRTTDLVARYGGEEFVMVLPRTDPSGAVELAERVRAAVEGARWPNRPITVSIGVATLDPSMDKRGDLVEAADTALYASKQSGRNRVTLWERESRAA